VNILVTGAAGYIGSIVAEQLTEQGHRVIAVDNLQQGHRQALDAEADFILADLGDRDALDDIFLNREIEAVMHFAADSIVPESMSDPQKYFQNNVVYGLNLLNTMIKNNVLNLIFSSSAAVYGEPQAIPITESAALAPVNPYGECKLMFEKILKWYGAAYRLNSISLRYFNAAGASPLHGEHHTPETHLIPNVLKVALKKAGSVSIFGTDYDTPDGSCVRDYVHVIDIAEAHIRALDRIKDAGVRAYNLGSEKGYSVLEVVRTAENVTGIKIPMLVGPRREGDPPVLVASSGLAKKELGWNLRFSQLEYIVKSAWLWQSKFPDGY
jgi:UDP-glucose 4-epimerase